MDYSEERTAAKRAEIVLNSLVPTTPRTDANTFAVRYAAATARDAIKNMSSEAALDAARGEASTALNGVCGLMDRQALTRDIIDRARRAVAAWLGELEKRC
jgi:hypothetical protein